MSELEDQESKREKIARLNEVRQQYRLSVIKEQEQRQSVIKGLKELYPQMDNQELIDLSYNVVLKDKDDHLKVENQDIKVEDLQFMLAESIERLCSGTTPTQEYFSWFEDCADIMSHMNDGYISNADLDERNGWVSYSYTREAEIMTCLALYKSSLYPLAEKKYDFLYNKLVKLRQIRTSIIESTVGTSDEKDRKNKETEKKDDNEYLKYMSSMSNIAKNTITWNLPVSELQDLKIYHGDDYDLAGEYEYFYGQLEPHPETLALPGARTKYAFEKDLKQSFIHSLQKHHYEELSPAEEMYCLPSHEEETIDQVENRIYHLRKHSINSARRRHKKFFDAMRYRSLDKK